RLVEHAQEPMLGGAGERDLARAVAAVVVDQQDFDGVALRGDPAGHRRERLGQAQLLVVGRDDQAEPRRGRDDVGAQMYPSALSLESSSSFKPLFAPGACGLFHRPSYVGVVAGGWASRNSGARIGIRTLPAASCGT